MAARSSFFFDKPRIGLRWLIRLRWLAAAGQIVTCAATAWILQIPIPLALLGGCVAVTLGSNLLMEAVQNRLRDQSTTVCTLLLALDTLTLTVMLYWTGGIQNPFATFYLLHVTIAAILLPVSSTWMIVGLCAVGQGAQFLSPHTLPGDHPLGGWIAMVLTAVFIAYFVSKLSRELTEARRRAARSEKFESLATLSAGIAHELATPLGTIAVVSADLEQSEGDAATSADAKLIRSEVERCRTILEKLSDQATRGIGDVAAAVPLAELRVRLTPYLKPEHARRVNWPMVSGLDELIVPETALLQCLAVLIKNAGEASRPDQPIDLQLLWREDEVKFSIRDQGCGMPPEITARVGEPFFTTKEPGVGMGLGLFLVRTFVERVRGRLDIESSPGEGTVIRLSIPLKNPQTLSNEIADGG